MFKKKIMDARPSQEERVVQDLDSLVEKSSYVRLHGKNHEIKPILVSEFFELANALAEIKKLENKTDFSLNDVVDSYFSLFMPLIPTITKDDICNSSHAQIAALLSHVMDHIQGRGHTEEKKKILTRMMLPA